MEWTRSHGSLLAAAVSHLLGQGRPGAVAFMRCLAPRVVRALAADAERFVVPGWDVFLVGERTDPGSRSISADRAVEIRESKGSAALFLVDTASIGAGMDGVYSATRELTEIPLFSEATKVALQRLNPELRRYVREAIKRARERGLGIRVSPWQELDFYCRVVDGQQPGASLGRIGLWPVKRDGGDAEKDSEDLRESRRFVDRLLDARSMDLTPRQRIDSLRLLEPTEAQLRDLRQFLGDAAALPVMEGLKALRDREHLWVNALKTDRVAQDLLGIEVDSWRGKTNKILKWSGLADRGNEMPQLVLPLNAEGVDSGATAKLEARWKVRPSNLQAGAVDYRVEVLTTVSGEQLAAQDLTHAKKPKQKAIFTDEDFQDLPDDVRVAARIKVSAVGSGAVGGESRKSSARVLSDKSEEFEIVRGELPNKKAAAGMRYRTFSDGLIELSGRDVVTAMASFELTRPAEAKGGFLVWRSTGERRNFKVFRPPLIKDVEDQWRGRNGVPGRWRIRVRMSGERIGDPEFVPLRPDGVEEDKVWTRATKAGRRMVDLFADVGGVGQLYDSATPNYRNIVEEYLRSWLALLRLGTPSLALAQTVEVEAQSGDLVGLIVLPAHPLRVAWHSAYDNLALHAVFEEGGKPKAVRDELASLDGAALPAFLPGVKPGSSFVFADTLGFHAVGMVAAGDPEPKGTLSMLYRALTGQEDGEHAAVPTVGSGSAEILGREIQKYIESHSTTRILHVHALRAGDGKTVVRALGRAAAADGGQATESENKLAYILEIHPSEKQRNRGIAGRFISEAQEKRRRGAGTVAREDRWMLTSQERPGGVRLPNLRWARKESLDPESAAHVALAFDTFASEVQADPSREIAKPHHAYGLMSFLDRRYQSDPHPRWEGVLPSWNGGEAHPEGRKHTQRLQGLQAAIQKLVATNIDAAGIAAVPSLVTEVSLDAADSLDRLHGLSDWVITLDRNAGLEYFDSPLENEEVYDKFVIDCVPEREDLGCLRLITSTSNLDEVQDLVDEALDEMGLSHSPRSADFLMSNLKALSGRLAIRLTGGSGPTSELVALAMSQANCRQAAGGDQQSGTLDDQSCWVSLEHGFLVPVDDIRDLLPSDVLPRRGGNGRPRSAARPDLIHVHASPRGGLSFRFVEVKYRRHLRAARSPQLMRSVRGQTASLEKRWFDWFGPKPPARSLRAIRMARLARILHFYAAKARRHGLPEKRYRAIVAQIDKMVEQSATYRLHRAKGGNRGWVFCPEYRGTEPMQISPEEWDDDVRVFLFGPAVLPGIAQHQLSTTETLAEDDSSELRTTTSQLDLGGSLSQQVAPPETEPSTTPDEVGASNRQEENDEDDRADAEAGPSEPSSTVREAVVVPAPPPRIILGTDRFKAAAQWHLTVKGNPHLLVAGLPGMGKTTCLLNLCKQMIAADVRPIVFSYHEDIDERLELLESQGTVSGPLTGSVRFVDFDGLGFNPLRVLDRSWKSAHIDIAGIIRDIFMAIYPDLGPLQGAKIRTAVKQSFEELGWGSAADTKSLSEPPFRRFLEIMRSELKPGIGLKNLLARLEELDDYGFFEVGTEHGSLWNADRPTVIRIHRTKNDVLQNAFASLLLYGLYKNMFQRGIQDRITHAVIVDEAHRAARLSLIPTLAKECRKYGVSLVLASQQATDFHASVFSAIANYLVLRMTEADAKTLVRNVAGSAQQRSLVDRIKQMDRFKALYFSSQGARPRLLELPDFSPSGDVGG